MKPDIGIKDEERGRLSNALSQALADTYALYAKTHAYHWNVTGPQFHGLHTMFETQYRALWESLDDLAERMRALGAFAPGPEDVVKQSRIVADNGQASARQMVLNLIRGHETLSKTLQEGVALAEAAADTATADLLTAQLQFTQKAAWMLRATAEE